MLHHFTLQAIMADIFVTELGGMLATNNLSDELGVNTLPSPKDLKQKILLKGKIKLKKKVKEYSLYATDFVLSKKYLCICTTIDKLSLFVIQLPQR